jgi:hypothetical protein
MQGGLANWHAWINAFVCVHVGRQRLTCTELIGATPHA